MNSKFKIFLVAFVVLAFAFTAMAQLGGATYPNVVWSYGPATNYWFGASGTNDTDGYTNDLKTVEISKGAIVNIGAKIVGYSANASNAVTLRIWPSVDGVNKAGVTAANGTVSAASPLSWAIVPAGTTPVNVYTNLASWATLAGTPATCPYILMQLENPDSNPVALTNVVVTVTVK